ncbi:patatin-like phospholipase family protein [Verrucomicrobium sp. BvORR034]|uniref:patatin-like phospholipase family protein n=1 Tax=Verrucomicrobium sp. BvORR034 TaxID=1396418 RepID=UPI00067911CE|nr:patatin-like phospholipase family protein [Verrucomicrobium sp. BvORR034]
MRLPDAMRRFPWFSAEDWLNRFMEAPPAPVAPPPPRLGLVLSCGGARGLAHVGVIQVLEREKIPISAIIGSSMGSYVGTLWAAGFNGQQLEELAAEIKDRRTLLRLIDPVCPPLSGFLRGNKLRRHLEKSLGQRTLAQLERPMYVVATNLDSVSWEVMSMDTPAAAAVQASCAIPGIVAPVELDGKRYIDGGASQPLPVNLLRDILSRGESAHAAGDQKITSSPMNAIIAVNVMPTPADLAAAGISTYPIPPPPPEGVWRRLRNSANRKVNLFAYGNVLDTFKRCLTSAQLRLIAEEGTRADILVHPYFGESRWYDFENFNRYIEAGRMAAEAALPRILDLIQRPTPVPEHSSDVNHGQKNAADAPLTPASKRHTGLPGYV